MKTPSFISWVSLCCGMVASIALGEAPVITCFQGNGTVTWTNAVLTNAIYAIEWGSSLEGPWHRTFQSLARIEAHSNTVFTAAVPMFYRVVMMTNPAPVGMVFIDAGVFQMGDNYVEGSVWALPVHTNYISAFYMDKYETSKAQWDSVRTWATNNGYSDLRAGDAGWTLQPNGPAGQSNHPVVNVSWYDCVKWCNARSEKEGLAPVYYTDDAQTNVYRSGQINITAQSVKWQEKGYRLPTEAQWEKAARGGLTGHHYPWPSYGGSWTDHIAGSRANFEGSGDPHDQGTTPVGYYNGSQVPGGSDMANGYGLYDMAGNVWEWCWDWFDDYYATSPVTDPTGPLSSQYGNRVLRGGSWQAAGAGAPHTLTCAWRDNLGPTYFITDVIGFRCVRLP